MEGETCAMCGLQGCNVPVLILHLLICVGCDDLVDVDFYFL